MQHKARVSQLFLSITTFNYFNIASFLVWDSNGGVSLKIVTIHHRWNVKFYSEAKEPTGFGKQVPRPRAKSGKNKLWFWARWKVNRWWETPIKETGITTHFLSSWSNRNQMNTFLPEPTENTQGNIWDNGFQDTRWGNNPWDLGTNEESFLSVPI